MVVRPYRALDQTPGQRGPSDGVYVGAEIRIFACKGKTRGGQELQTHQDPLVNLPCGWARTTTEVR